jgi:penicillin G amidase
MNSRVLILLALGVSIASSQSQKPSTVPSLDAEALARSVTIYRDTHGVPHVFGTTDASTVFGLAYPHAEDNFWRLARRQGCCELAGTIAARQINDPPGNSNLRT